MRDKAMPRKGPPFSGERLRTIAALIVALGLTLVSLARSRAQENSDCLACHGDRGITAERKGRTVSLYVSEKGFAASIHAGLSCVNCHQDLEGKELPHDTPLKKVNCGACHETEAKQHAASLHGKAMKRGDALAPTCASCHTMHDIKAVKDPLSPVSPLNVPFTCGKCHQEGTLVMQQRMRASDLLFGGVDLLLAVLFAIAFLKTPRHLP